MNKKSLLAGLAISLSPFCGSSQAAALVPTFLPRHVNASLPSPACFSPATVSLSPSICDKITELEEGFIFVSFVCWVFCPGKFHFNVLAPSLVVGQNTRDLLSSPCSREQRSSSPGLMRSRMQGWMRGQMWGWMRGRIQGWMRGWMRGRMRDMQEQRSLPSAGELCLGHGPGPLRARILKVYFTTAPGICIRLQESIKSSFGITT